MYLYHGTTASFARKAFDEGLKPRGEGISRWKAASNPHSVYLTSAYAMHFAVNAAEGGEDLAIIEIDTGLIDERRLFADEDALLHAWDAGKVDAGAGNAVIRALSIEDRAMHFSRNLEDWALDGADWQWSMNVLGNCTHRGCIAPEAITRVAFFTGSHAWWLQWHDPVVSLQNFRYMGNYYVATNLVFMGRLNEARGIDLGIMACDLDVVDLSVAPRRTIRENGSTLPSAKP